MKDKERQNSRKKSKESEIIYLCRKCLVSDFHKKCCLLLKNSQESGHSNRHKRAESPRLRKMLSFFAIKKKKKDFSRVSPPLPNPRSNRALVHVVPTSNYWETQISASICNSQEEQQHCSMFMSAYCFASLRDTSPWG